MPARSAHAAKSARRTKSVPYGRTNAQAIISAGVKLAATGGVGAISYRALGAELDVDPSAIYYHFRSKNDLMRALLDALHAEVLQRLSKQGTWQDRLMELAEVALEVHTGHAPIAVDSTTVLTGGPAEAQTIEYILEAFTEAGLSDDDVVKHYAQLSSYMLAHIVTIARSRSARGLGSRTDAVSWYDGPILIDPVNQPRAASLITRISSLSDADVYMIGVRAIIHSAEQAH